MRLFPSIHWYSTGTKAAAEDDDRVRYLAWEDERELRAAHLQAFRQQIKGISKYADLAFTMAWRQNQRQWWKIEPPAETEVCHKCRNREYTTYSFRRHQTGLYHLAGAFNVWSSNLNRLAQYLWTGWGWRTELTLKEFLFLGQYYDKRENTASNWSTGEMLACLRNGVFDAPCYDLTDPNELQRSVAYKHTGD